MPEFVLFNDIKPVGFCNSPGNAPSRSTLYKKGADNYKLLSECSKDEIEQAQRNSTDDRDYEGARQRVGGHGYKGGDGYKRIP